MQLLLYRQDRISIHCKSTSRDFKKLSAHKVGSSTLTSGDPTNLWPCHLARSSCRWYTRQSKSPRWPRRSSPGRPSGSSKSVLNNGEFSSVFIIDWSPILCINFCISLNKSIWGRIIMVHLNTWPHSSRPSCPFRWSYQTSTPRCSSLSQICHYWEKSTFLVCLFNI